MRKHKIRVRHIALMLGMLLLSTNIVAQQRTISGTVTDQNGDPVIGATVIVKEGTQGTVTNVDGKYTLGVPATARTLIFRSVGKINKEVDIAGSVVNVVLEDLLKTLDEVVVIGYGTQRKRDLTGSISSVSEKALKDIPVATVAEALTGKLPGVQVTTTEGSPDAEIKIRVRGGGSITQSNSPLYIVDGFLKDDIKDVAPSEIQSIDVLKDASSTAIYGSRGANGVIIITTKSAKQGKISLSYDGYVGFKNITKKLDVLSPYQFVQKQYERATWNNAVASEYEKYFGSYEDIDLYNYKNGTNWQDETFGRTGFQQNHSVALSGGTKQLKYNFSYTNLSDKAIMAMSDYNRNNFSGKLNYQPLKWLKLDVAARYAATVINGSGANDVTGSEKSTSDSRVKNAVIYTPIELKNMVAQDDDMDAVASLYSPLVTTADNNRYQKKRDYNINGGFTVNFAKNLSLRSTYGLTKSNKDDKRFYGVTSYFAREGGALKRDNAVAPSILLTNGDVTTLQNTNVLNFSKDDLFAGQDLSVTLGHEMYSRSSENTTSDIQAFPVDYDSFMAWDDIASGTNRYGDAFFRDMDDRMISFFGRVNYNILDRYLLAATFRTDGSSKFSGANKWGYFPSVSAGWRISEEKFMKGLKPVISNLKLRASYGESGNNNISNSAFKRTYSISNTAYLPSGSMQTSIYTPGLLLVNPLLRWETTVTRNGGLDFGFFDNRINGSFELYSNSTQNVLLQMPITGVGYTYQWQNAASTSNRGAELSLNIGLVESKNFNLNFMFNISANQNKVDDLGGLDSYSFNEAWTSMTEASNSYVVKPGEPVGQIYGYVNEGWYSAKDFMWNGTKWVMNSGKYNKYDAATKIYSDQYGNKFVDNSSIDGLSWGPGAMKLKDQNDDGKITDLDRVVIGNTNPAHFGSFAFSGDFRGFDFALNFNWVYGNDIYNANKIEMSSFYYKYRNMLSSNLNSYTTMNWETGKRITDVNELDLMNANSHASIWAPPTGRYAITSWAIEDGSFLRFNNMTVGYTLPARLLKGLYVQKLRLYATAYNIYTFTNYSGYDPEVDTRRATPCTPGVDYSAYPRSRSYNFGINLTF